MTQYKEMYAQTLSNGLRAKGLQKCEVCKEFGISEKTYNLWVREYDDFAEAHEIGERDYKCFYAKVLRNYLADTENPAVPYLIFIAKEILNIAANKKEEDETPPIVGIEIHTLPSGISDEEIDKAQS